MLQSVMSRFSVEVFFVSQYQNISQRNPSMLCFRKFLVAQKFMDKREGEKSRFPLKNFCVTVPKIRRGTFHGVTEFGYRKTLSLRGLCHNFSSSFFVSRCQKTMRGNPSLLCFRKFPVAKKFMGKMEGEISRFPSKFFVSHWRNILQWSPFVLCLGKFRVAISLWMTMEGVSYFSVEFFLSQKAKKICRGTL